MDKEDLAPRQPNDSSLADQIYTGVGRGSGPMVGRQKLERLLGQVLEGRGSIRFHEFESLIEALGFRLRRQRGSHRIYVHPNLDRAFPVQPEGKDAKRYQLRELRDMIRKYRLRLDADK